jgi:hypothetical protein
MTDEQINAAIDKIMGKSGCQRGGGIFEQDWCNDLNAMYEAEKSLNSGDIFEAYYLALYETTRSTRWPVCATARQRAEAFLRTLGKWEEEAK